MQCNGAHFHNGRVGSIVAHLEFERPLDAPIYVLYLTAHPKRVTINQNNNSVDKSDVVSSVVHP